MFEETHTLVIQVTPAFESLLTYTYILLHQARLVSHFALSYIMATTV